MMNKMQFSKWMITGCLSILGVFLMAQSGVREVTDVYVIKNAMVVQQPGTVISGAHIIVRNGLIEAVGTDVAIPFDAKVIDADSMYVYAGFIDAASHAGIPKKEERRERPDGLIPGNPPNELAGITPDAKASAIISSKEKSIKDMRDNGFTISHVIPTGRMLPGQGAIISNRSGAVEEIVLRDEVSMFTQFRAAQRMYPATVIAIMSKWRDLYTNAKNMSEYASKFEMDPSGKKRPVMDEATQAMAKVVNGLPVFFEVDDVLDIHKALRLKNDLGFNLVLTDADQVYPALSHIKAQSIPVILSTDLPKELKKKDDKKEDEEVDEEKMALEKRKQEAYDQHVGQAALLEKEGVAFSFSFIDGKIKDFKKNVKRMIDAGLSEDAALAAMTTTPASMIGIDQMAGTIEAGKVANLVVTDKSYFDDKSNIRYVMVDGHLNEYEVKEKKKKSSGEASGEPIALEGEWTFEIEIPGQTQSGVIVVNKNGDDYEIKFASDEDPDDFTDASNIELEGSNLTFDATVDNGGFEMNLTFDLDVTPDSYEGTVSVGNFGSFPITGDKTSTPE